MVTSMQKIYDFDAYALLDPGANLSFVTTVLANRFHAWPKVLSEPFEFSTPIGESIVVQRVYQNSTMSTLPRVVLCDLVELSIIDINAIVGMDQL